MQLTGHDNPAYCFFFFFCSFFSFCFHEVVARWEEIQVEEYTRAKISVPKTVLFFGKYHYFDEELKDDQAHKNRTNSVFDLADKCLALNE